MSRYEALFRELSASGIDSPRVRALLHAGGAAAKLVAAIHAVEKQLHAQAAALAEAALAEAPRDALVRLGAGVVLGAAGQHQRGIEELGRAEEMDARLAPIALEAAFLQTASIGWDLEAIEIAARAAALGARAAEWHTRALRILAQRGDAEGALVHARALRALLPASASVPLELAGLLAAAGHAGEVRAEVEAALALAAGSTDHLLEGARVLIEAGEIEAARAALARAVEIEPACVPARVGLARLDLWAGDTAASAAALPAIRGLDARAAARIEGAIAVLDGRHEEAIGHLSTAIGDGARDAEALLFRAEAELRLGRLGPARADVSAAMLAPGFSPAGRILWLLLDLRELGGGQRVDRSRLEEVIEGVIELCPGAESTLASGDPAGIGRVMEAALSALRGNRTSTATHVVDGRLTRLAARTAPRHASRQALELVRVAPAARVLAALDAVAARYPASGLPLAHRGELHLWCGDTAAARRDFEAAIALERRTRFAYIGLTGVEILEGNLEGALDVSARGVATMHDTEGPAVPAYRGEALRRLGRTAEAIADLERSVAQNPTRLGAFVNLALARGDAGDARGSAEAFARVAAHAPALVSDAAREAGAAGGERAVLSHMLVMMRGNRSSACVTYFTREGRLRCAPQHAGGARSGAARELDRVRRLLATRLP